MTPPALLVVGHGTRDVAGVAGFQALVSHLADVAPAVVGGGFIELSRPPLVDVVAGLVGAGHREFGVVPLVLVGAGHAKGDIPASLAREKERHPGTAFRYGRPLGPHPVLLDLLDARLSAVLPASERAGTAVVLVGRGSTDPDANAEVSKVARLLFEGRGLLTVETSFVSLAEPGVPAALERCRRLGAERAVVLPYFLFRGVLPDRVAAQTEAFTGLPVRTAEVLADDDAGRRMLAGLVLERYREALVGDLRMNCDTCVYRIAMPGFEDKVGRPQAPHDHPDDPGHGHGDGHGHGHGDGHPREVPAGAVAT